MTRPLDEPLFQGRSVATRRNTVTNILLSHPEASDRRISRIAAVSRELVRDIRREMIRKSLIESRYALHRIGADGKHYSRLPRPKTHQVIA